MKRVAVIGASGIGRHHAKWWHIEGADVCAFLGRSDASNRATTETLQNLFAFRGTGYTELQNLLDSQAPDIVDVCSPHPLHFQHARAAMLADCDVLCEKPLVYDPAMNRNELMLQADTLLSLAAERDLLFGMATQLPIGARHCYESLGSPKLDTFQAVLKTPVRAGTGDLRSVWADLGPHLLGALIELFPHADIDWPELRVENHGWDVTAEFQLTHPRIRCRLTTGKTTGDPTHIRILRFNDDEFHIGGKTGPDGHYGARYEHGANAQVQEDMMRLLIRDFLAGTPSVTPIQARRNTDWLLRIAESGLIQAQTAPEEQR